MDAGECSKPCEPSASSPAAAGGVWAKLVPADSTYPEVEVAEDDTVVCSLVAPAAGEDLAWCEIRRAGDASSATIRSLSSDAIIVDVDGRVIQQEAIDIKPGSEIVPGPKKEGTEFCGFRCSPGAAHLHCNGCGGMMPGRANTSIPQKYLGCDRAFCGAYWCSQVVSSKRCVQQSGQTLQAVISEWIAKFDNKELDRSRLQLNHVDAITSRTYLCNHCYNKFIDFLLYWFRVSMPINLLPPDAANRESCWYGFMCRSQHHRPDHAKKLNHVCRLTRGNP